VVFSHVVEHLVEPLKALGHAAALLKPRGLLFCEVPNNEALIARQSGLAWEHLDIRGTSTSSPSGRWLRWFTARPGGAAGLLQRLWPVLRGLVHRHRAANLRPPGRVAGWRRNATRNSAGRAWRLLARTASPAAV
jgi:hypothetical protein